MTWMYAWQSPRKGWMSDFIFSTHATAVDNAIWHARNERRRKHLFHLPPEKKQREKVWRSMRQAGWKVRRQKVPQSKPPTLF